MLYLAGGAVRVEPGGAIRSSAGVVVDGRVEAVSGFIATLATKLYDGTNITCNASLGSQWRVTLTNDAVLAVPTGLTDGQHLRWWIRQGTGTNRLTLGTSWKYPVGANLMTNSTTIGAVDVIHACYDGVWSNLYLTGFMRYNP
jgi:hypothetical protein